ncbi:hypothetical protein ACHAW5_000773 [Stephanodiscus triporus]|uniref:Uncharacterized protein n=1 Tax=Stephanodiscus triporus TaxID=2934178 RepID=A0ABD3MWV7_9STRA
MTGDCHHRIKCLGHVWKISFVLVAVVGVRHNMAFGEDLQSASASTSASTTDYDDNDSSSSAPVDCAANLTGQIVQSLFRFPASDLVLNLTSSYRTGTVTGFITSSSADLPQITPEPAGVNHAFYSVSTAAATLFRRQCYGPAPRKSRLDNLYNNFEQRKKGISFEYMKDGTEEMRLMHLITKRFYHAFESVDAVIVEDGDANYHGTSSIHEKKSKSTVNTIYAESTLPSDCDLPSKLSYQTNDHVGGNDQAQAWSWYSPGQFSDRGISGNISFRRKMYMSMRNELQRRLQQLVPGFKFEYGRQSGMFWYPPGGVREWHNNRLDLVGNTNGKGGRKHEEEIFKTQVWRMYFVRTVRDKEFDKKLSKLKKSEVVDQSSNDHSAMHIIPGDDGGITLEVLRRAGARPLNQVEEMRQWSDEFAEGQTVPPPEENVGRRNNEDDTVLDRDAVWRIPDKDGYVTLFRLPKIWHCIVSEEVHRYSLGFAFSDKEVQALLKLADVEFDVVNGNENSCGV